MVLRIKLESAAQMLEDDPERAARWSPGSDGRWTRRWSGLRSLARGIYPSVLHEHGLVEALKSVGRRAPVPVSVRGSGIGRYREDIEVAVYFCCLEALQNIAKHAGAGASGAIILWQDRQRLWFEVRDSGAGFDRTRRSIGQRPGQHARSHRCRWRDADGELAARSRHIGAWQRSEHARRSGHESSPPIPLITSAVPIAPSTMIGDPARSAEAHDLASLHGPGRPVGAITKQSRGTSISASMIRLKATMIATVAAVE